ncbi:MAG: hypothetical protein AUJ52_05635 [Elusimicrobia bacterium CG1_02_63_36]|nr:MAG: hypothetical protein AUJ52_05635 [Elusimicrobia bacterium CG1_02_63_36]
MGLFVHAPSAFAFKNFQHKRATIQAIDNMGGDYPDIEEKNRKSVITWSYGIGGFLGKIGAGKPAESLAHANNQETDILEVHNNNGPFKNFVDAAMENYIDGNFYSEVPRKEGAYVLLGATPTAFGPSFMRRRRTRRWKGKVESYPCF